MHLIPKDIPDADLHTILGIATENSAGALIASFDVHAVNFSLKGVTADWIAANIYLRRRAGRRLGGGDGVVHSDSRRRGIGSCGRGRDLGHGYTIPRSSEGAAGKNDGKANNFSEMHFWLAWLRP